MSHKVQAWTRKKLHRAEVRKRREAATEAREERARLAAALRPRPSEYAFRGCSPERTLALLGEEW